MVHVVAGDDPMTVHRLMAETLDRALDEIAAIQRAARAGGAISRPRWRLRFLAASPSWQDSSRRFWEGLWRTGSRSV